MRYSYIRAKVYESEVDRQLNYKTKTLKRQGSSFMTLDFLKDFIEQHDIDIKSKKKSSLEQLRRGKTYLFQIAEEYSSKEIESIMS